MRASSCLSRHRGNKSATANKKRTVCVTNFVVVHGVTCGMELIRSYGSDEENVSTVSVPETLDSTLDSNTSRWSSTYSNYSITSNFTSSTSKTNEIDEAVRNIMMDKDKDKDTMTDNNNMRHCLARFVIESMQEQVVLLKEEVTFLRIESNTKNSMIGQLMSENTQLRANQFKTNTPSDRSEFLHELMRNRHTSSISLDSDMSLSAHSSDGDPEEVTTHDEQLTHPERTTETRIKEIPIRDPLTNLWEDYLRNPSWNRHPSNTIIAASINQQPQQQQQQQQ